MSSGPVAVPTRAYQDQNQNQGQPEVLGESIDLRGPAQTGAGPYSGGKAPVPQPAAPALTREQLAKISAKSFLVYDQETGTVLASRQPDQKLPIASLTKLMTGLLAYQYLDFSQPVIINKTGLTSIRPIVDFKNADEVRAGDVFNAMIVGSCNDSAQVLAQAITQKTGTSVVTLMNQKAQELGMDNTSYANPIGFDNPDNYSTADDLKILVEITQRLAIFSNLGKTNSVTFSGSDGQRYHAVATNRLIAQYPELYAVKTGYTEGAQGVMVSKIVRTGHNVIIIVLGSRDREADTVLLKNLVADRTVWQ